MTVADHGLTAIEKTLLKTHAMYRYTEILPQIFLVTAGIRSRNGTTYENCNGNKSSIPRN